MIGSNIFKCPNFRRTGFPADCTMVRKLFDFIKRFDSCKNSSLRTFQWVKPLFSLMQDCIIRIERLNKCIAHLFWVMNLLFFMQRGLELTPFVPILPVVTCPSVFGLSPLNIFFFQQNILTCSNFPEYF